MSLLGTLLGTARTEQSPTHVYPDVLDSTDETAVAECIRRFYDCEEVYIDEDGLGMWLTIRSESNHSVHPRLLRHLQCAGFDIITVTSRKRNGCFRLEVEISRYPPEAYR
jgi:hypothetical protein